MVINIEESLNKAEKSEQRKLKWLLLLRCLVLTYLWVKFLWHVFCFTVPETFYSWDISIDNNFEGQLDQHIDLHLTVNNGNVLEQWYDIDYDKKSAKSFDIWDTRNFNKEKTNPRFVLFSRPARITPLSFQTDRYALRVKNSSSSSPGEKWEKAHFEAKKTSSFSGGWKKQAKNHHNRII